MNIVVFIVCDDYVFIVIICDFVWFVEFGRFSFSVFVFDFFVMSENVNVFFFVVRNINIFVEIFSNFFWVFYLNVCLFKFCNNFVFNFRIFYNNVFVYWMIFVICVGFCKIDKKVFGL